MKKLTKPFLQGPKVMQTQLLQRLTEIIPKNQYFSKIPSFYKPKILFRLAIAQAIS